MGLLSKLFSKNDSVKQSSEAKDIIHYQNQIDNLLRKKEYISKKAYSGFIARNQQLFEQLPVIKNNGLLKEYSRKNGVDSSVIEDVIKKHSSIDILIEEHNRRFIERQMVEEKEYLDNILKKVDPSILLDDDQRKVVLSDEDYTLVIAGAGAGKTTTVAAKVKYLIEKKNIDPKQILVVSFTNKAVGELKEKINKDLGFDVPISTFHSVGNAILRKEDDQPKNIIEQSRMYYIILNYFKQSVLNNETMINNLILFFASYFDAPFEGKNLNDFFNRVAKANNTTLKSELDEYKDDILDHQKKKTITIQNEVLRSRQEVEIANFLYLNGIDYKYEPIYPYLIANSKKPYTPDFMIHQGEKIAYIEHFGISESGTNKLYSDEQITKYKDAVNDKIKIHRAHQTNLIYTFSSYNDRRELLDHLKEKLIENGFELRPRSNKEVMEKLISSESSRYIRKLISLICRFIGNFKTCGYDLEDFDRMSSSTQNVRTKLFLNITKECYLEYERCLRETNSIDFEDLINKSVKLLQEVKDMKKKLDFKYIIVDEYQDISMQRYDLVTALSEVTNAKIIAVGDDWQSIYAFSGSDISLFTDFEKKVGYALKQKITKTYRNSQDIIDIAGSFVQKNDSQIKKELQSPKRIEDPIIIYTYDTEKRKANESKRKSAAFQQAYAVETALGTIANYNKQEKKNRNTVLVLGRFGFDADMLEWTGLFHFKGKTRDLVSVKYPQFNLVYMTAHASKGLGYDNVIVINGKNEMFGFPAKIEDDPVLQFVVKNDRSFEYAEERRLFYVAITRTKNRVFFIAPEKNPSEFLLEIKKEYKNVKLVGRWNETPVGNTSNRKTCPICGYPMVYKYKNAYGLKLHICTNEPELCGFMTNEYAAGKLSIQKCDKCTDGYLIVKKSSNTNKYFLGCTNYKENKTGCNNAYFPGNAYIIEENKTPEKPKMNYVSSGPKMDREDIKIETSENMPLVLYDGVNLAYLCLFVVKQLQVMDRHRSFGVCVVADILHGGKGQKLERNNLTDSKYYGIMETMPRKKIESIIHWMIDAGYINQTKQNYPTIHLSENGYRFSSLVTETQLKQLKKKLEEE